MLVKFTNCFRSISILLTAEESERLRLDGPREALSKEHFDRVNNYFGGVTDVRLADWEHIFATLEDTPLAEGLLWEGGLNGRSATTNRTTRATKDFCLH